jgi:hypothetical protein
MTTCLISGWTQLRPGDAEAMAVAGRDDRGRESHRDHADSVLKRAEAAVHVADERLLANLKPDERREFERILHAVGLQGVDIAAPSCIASNAGRDKGANT